MVIINSDQLSEVFMTTIRAYIKKVFGRIHPFSAAVLFAFVLLSLTAASALTPAEGEKELYNSIIRFHVLANSDSEEDQSLKLVVRDRVTGYTTALLSDCESISEAKKIISEHKTEILDIARRAVRENGYSYDVTLETGFEMYPRRTYGNYTFPAGEYYSLKLKIGKAQGKNWWCVLFPPMCLGSAVTEEYDSPESLENIGFTDSEINLISDEGSIKKEIRFYFLDLITGRK